MSTQDIVETLRVLKSPTFDGDLPSKSVRDYLYTAGLVIRHRGYNWLTEQGFDHLAKLAPKELPELL